MYIVRNIFGMIRVFDEIVAAEEAYFDEVAFCGFAALINVYTGEPIRESF